MIDEHMKKAPMYAMKNRRAIEESELCGCYHCLTISSTKDIAQWTDWGQTALCPSCEKDCLIAQSFGILMDETSMRAIKDYWLVKQK